LLAKVLSNFPYNIRFNRTLNEEIWKSWVSILRILINVNLSDELDSFKWNLTTTGIFLVKSMYADYLDGHMVFLTKY
jgi:hypothetical protein